MDKSIAVNPAVTREAKTWKSRVNAITWRVHCRFGGSRLKVRLTWSTDSGSLLGAPDDVSKESES
jgi:hypothetical protein